MPRRLAGQRFFSIVTLVITFVITLIALPWMPVAGQGNFRDVIEMSVEAGFDSFFRPDVWTPVTVNLKNNGESVVGRLVIRPETSGIVVGNAFSSAIDLPSGSEKSTLLNIKARTFPDDARVELIDNDGLVRASQEAGLIDLSPQDQLYAIVTGPNTTPPGLTGAHIGGFKAEQANWGINDIPDFADSLAALDMMMLINIDSEGLSSSQRSAIRHWVESGGHLIICGGPTALISTAGLSGLLPLIPQDSRSLNNLNALARYSGDARAGLGQRAIIATGALHEDAQALAAQGDIPLLARRALGAGLVDYLAADPTLEPLASWDKLSDLWLKLLATRAPHPAWRGGFTLPTWGAEAVANLPGVNLLPPLQTLCLFLASYIVLIGPLNYFILSRLRRNGWGWFTIPLVIVCFAGIAWTVGFNLRGSEIIISRLTYVQSYADRDEAQVNQFVGLLSPRRATYSLAVPEGHFLAVAGATTPSNIFASNTIQTATEISQSGGFSAQDFTVDGGIFANFSVGGRVPKLSIDGSFTLDFEISESGRMISAYQGVISNNSEVALRDAVILGPSLEYRLEGDFAPGDILTLDSESLRAEITDSPAQPNPLEANIARKPSGLSPFSGSGRNITIKDLQGNRYLRMRSFLNSDSRSERQAAREQAFLASFMVDQFGSSARGSGLYLLGWSDEWPRDLSIGGGGWSAIDTTLYIIELDVAIQLPPQRVTLTTEHFSWMTLERQGVIDNGVDGFNLYEQQSVEFLFHPLPGLALDTVEHMLIDVDRGGGYGQALHVELYNWLQEDYDIFTYRDGSELQLSAPRRYLGPGKALRLRLRYSEGIGAARVRKIRIEQTGRY